MNRHAGAIGRAHTIAALLALRAEQSPERIAYTFLEDGEERERNLTYAELDADARAIASFLRAKYSRGSRVLLMYPPGPAYIAAFFGCLYAGVIAVPTYPQSAAKLARPDTRLRAIALDCRPAAALTSADLLKQLQPVLAVDAPLGRIAWHTTDSMEGSAAPLLPPHRADERSIAFLQYTSGSTAAPKGVMVTHRNALHNQEVIKRACGHSDASTFVGWLPFYHDMGLIGNILQPLYLGSRSILMSPLAFLQKPNRWLRAISRYRGVTSGGPNFAYELCVRKITDHEREGLDLTSWTIAFNGAEPIRAETMHKFAEAFGPCGFRQEAFYPCYGLAEATLMVTASRPLAGPVVRHVDSQQLAAGTATALHADAGGKPVVSSGRLLPGQEVAIVDRESGRRCGDGAVGEILVAGPSVARGYWRRATETVETFQARVEGQPRTRYLRTGDLGFVQNGDLFVTGRLKDMVIVRGRNYYPQDIELSVEQAHPSLRPGGGAAFAVEEGDGERLVVVHEVDRSRTPEILDEIAEAIRRAVAHQHDIEPRVVVLIDPGQLPKTSSGKVRRHACRDAFCAGQLEAVHVVDYPDEPASNAGLQVSGDVAPLDALGVDAGVRLVVADLLGSAPDAHDDPTLASLGMDSLRAIELRARIARAWGVDLSAVPFLEELHVRELVGLVRHGMQVGNAERLPSAPHSNDSQKVSEGQRALWLAQQLVPETAAYNVCRGIRLRGALDVAALRLACDQLYRRHGELRRGFASSATGPVRVASEAGLSFTEYDVSAESDGELAARVASLEQAKLSLESGPLVQFSLFRRAADDHLLVFNLHHIVCDLWSVAILVSELATLYTAAVEGTDMASCLAALGATYADYVSWQTAMIASADGQRVLDEWRATLTPPAEPLALPFDRPRQYTLPRAGATVDFRIPSSTVEVLNTRYRAAGASRFVGWLSLLFALLHRYTGSEDLVVGVPVAGRSRPEFANLVGYFVNVVPLRMRAARSLSFHALVAGIREAARDAVARQDYPFTAVLDRMPQLRDGRGAAPFNVLFAFHGFPTRELEPLLPLALGRSGGRARLGRLEIETADVRQRGAQFDLAVHVVEYAGGVDGVIEYDADLFESATIERLSAHLCGLAEAIAARSAGGIGDVPVIDVDERARLAAWGSRYASYAGAPTVIELFEEQVERTPDAPAVSDERTRLNYRELNGRANQLARHLLEQGVGPETVVGVCMDRSVELEIALLAIWKAGAAYLPLEPDHPAARLRTMMHDADASLVIVDSARAGRLGSGIRELSIDCLHAVNGSVDATNPSVPRQPGNAAYVIYTSGSTGQPKGVVNTNAGIRNRLLWMQDVYRLDASDRVLQKTPYSFDVSVWELFWPLMAGAELVMARPGGHRDSQYVARVLAERAITTVHFVPSQLRLLILEREFGAGALRRVICSGEALDRGLQDEFLSRCPAVSLNNLYGPTEASVDVTAASCRAGDAVTIGEPIANATIRILDEQMQLTPIGVVGELYIGGIALARGYVNRPSLTAERFVPDPHAVTAGACLYRTGDRSRWRTDGTIEFLGRADHQVKLRGVRIEPGEIEQGLRRCPGVRDAAVIVRDDALGGPYLAAYVAGGDAGSEPRWREHLRERLPESMLPAAFVHLDVLPMTGSGKVDRKALLAIPAVRSTPERFHVAPRTPIEEQIAAVWAAVFGLERVSVHDKFFDLGGHSLLATQVTSRLRDLFGIEVPLALLFSPGASVATLAGEIEHLLIRSAGSRETASLLQSVLDASDQEVAALLAGKTPARAQ
jgi:amino acid adenylation domain-containing protein